MVKQVSNPRDVYDHLSSVVVGQDDAMRNLSVSVFDFITREESSQKKNIILIGPTGTGKTVSALGISQVCNLPFLEINISDRTPKAYVGANLETAFADLEDETKEAVIFLDELDKIALISKYHPGRDNELNKKHQEQLIAIVERGNVSYRATLHDETKQLKTDDFLFVGAGAFVGLESAIADRLGVHLQTRRKSSPKLGFKNEPTTDGDGYTDQIRDLLAQTTTDDLIRYGFMPELAGRFQVVVSLEPLTRESLIGILKREDSVLGQELRQMKKIYQMSVNLTEPAYQIIVDAAMRQQTGARALQGIVHQLFVDLKFDAGKSPTQISITPDMALRYLKRLLPKDYRLSI